MTAPFLKTAAREATGISVHPSNNRIVMDAIKWAQHQTQADRLGVDADALARGHLIHLDRAFGHLDQYADDSADDRFLRQFKGETRAEQLRRRMAESNDG